MTAEERRQPRRTQEQRRAVTESALLEAAGELVVSGGVKALTIASVGERAGYSRGIVTHHFGSKNGLLDALARASQSNFILGIGDEPPGLTHLLLLLERYVLAIGSGRASAFLMLWAEALSSAKLAAVFADRDSAFRHDIEDDVTAGVADGSIRQDARAPEVAVALLAQLRGIGLQWMLSPDTTDLEQLAPVVVATWRRGLSTEAKR